MDTQIINYSEIEYYSDPWEHIIVRNMFTDGGETLANSKIKFRPKHNTPGGKIPIPFFELQEKGLKKYTRAIQTREFCKFMIDKFNDKIVEWYGKECDMSSWDDDLQTMVEVTFINKFSNTDVSLKKEDKKRIAHGRTLGWHLDIGKKPIVGIMWFREDDDTLEEPGNLVLGKYGGEDEKVIPYEKNTGVFWANTPDAWHRVQTRGESPNNMRRSLSWSIFTRYKWHDYQHLKDEDGNPCFGFHEVKTWKQSNSN